MIPDTNGMVSKLYCNRISAKEMDFIVHDNHIQYGIQRSPKRKKQVKLNGTQLDLLG